MLVPAVALGMVLHPAIDELGGPLGKVGPDTAEFAPV